MGDMNSPNKNDSRGSGMSQHSCSQDLAYCLARGTVSSYVILGSINFVYPKWKSVAIVYNLVSAPKRNASDHLEMNKATLYGSCWSCWFVMIHDWSFVFLRETVIMIGNQEAETSRNIPQTRRLFRDFSTFLNSWLGVICLIHWIRSSVDRTLRSDVRNELAMIDSQIQCFRQPFYHFRKRRDFLWIRHISFVDLFHWLSAIWKQK